MLTITDELTQEAAIIRVKRKRDSTNVIAAPTDLFLVRGPPDYIRPVNDLALIVRQVRAASALLHKLSDDRGPPLSERTYPAALLAGVPSAAQPFRTAMRLGSR